MTFLASKTEFAWNLKIFNWNDEIEYYGWIDRIGQSGIVYFLSGIYWAIGKVESLDQMFWVVWATFLSGIAVQGFRDETETPWRRGVGSMGAIFSLFMLSFTFVTSLYTYVTWMLMGFVALGFGFAYIARMGEVSTIFTEDLTEMQGVIVEQMRGDSQEPLLIPKPVLSENANNSEDVTLESVVKNEEVNETDSDDLYEEEVSLMPSLEKEIEETITEQETTFDYDLKLDSAVMSAIQNSLANTPHEGYKPIVSIGSNGNLTIDFVPM